LAKGYSRIPTLPRLAHHKTATASIAKLEKQNMPDSQETQAKEDGSQDLW